MKDTSRIKSVVKALVDGGIKIIEIVVESAQTVGVIKEIAIIFDDFGRRFDFFGIGGNGVSGDFINIGNKFFGNGVKIFYNVEIVKKCGNVKVIKILAAFKAVVFVTFGK